MISPPEVTMRVNRNSRANEGDYEGILMNILKGVCVWIRSFPCGGTLRKYVGIKIYMGWGEYVII